MRFYHHSATRSFSWPCANPRSPESRGHKRAPCDRSWDRRARGVPPFSFTAMASSSSRRIATMALSDVAEEFLRAVADRPHAFLQREILRVDADDAGVILRLLHLPVDHVIVRLIALQTERAGDVVIPAAPAAFSRFSTASGSARLPDAART